MTAAKAQMPPKAPDEKLEIPNYLVKETLDGIPLYYKEYQEVLNQIKTLEEIIGSSSLQGILVYYFMKLLVSKVGDDKFWFLTNKIGSHISHRNNMSHDIAIFDKTILPADKINTHYISVPAKVVLEIDIDIEPAQPLHWDYLTKKPRPYWNLVQKR